MNNVKLKKEDVLEAFANGHFTGVPAAAKEFNIKRSAIYLWADGEEIPEKRQLHLYKHRPDIIQKVQQIHESKRVDLNTPEQAA